MSKESRLTIEIGKEAEQAVVTLLKNSGLQIIECNYRCKLGEIDIVARDKQTVVFIEVRRRSHGQYGSGFDSVDYRKQQKLIRTAQAYLQKRKLFDQHPCRFDIVSLRSLTDMHWIKDAFQTH